MAVGVPQRDRAAACRLRPGPPGHVKAPWHIPELLLTRCTSCPATSQRVLCCLSRGVRGHSVEEPREGGHGEAPGHAPTRASSSLCAHFEGVHYSRARAAARQHSLPCARLLGPPWSTPRGFGGPPARPRARPLPASFLRGTHDVSPFTPTSGSASLPRRRSQCS